MQKQQSRQSCCGVRPPHCSLMVLCAACGDPVLGSRVEVICQRPHAVLQAVAHAEEQLGTPRQEGETQDSPKSQMNVSCMSLLSAICMRDVSQGCSVHMSCTPSWASLDGCRCFYS